MLKKFNLLVEEVTNEIEKDYRFFRASRYLSSNLTPEEKDTLNKKYNEVVKEELQEAVKTQKPMKIFYVSDNGWSGRWMSTVEKVWQENGKWFCTFLSTNFQMKKKMQLSYFKDSTWGPNKEDWEKDPEKCQKIADQRARRDCEKTQPISHITTEKILDMMYEVQKSLSQYDPKKYYGEFDKVDDDLKYLIENNFTSKDGILKGLSVPHEKSYDVFKACRTQDFQNQELLSKFHVDKNNKEFKIALSDSKASGQSWYYNGGTSLVLKAKITISAGKRFDFNRISVGDFKSQFKTKEGYGTQGEF